jgi:hypothetical protein
VTAGPEGGGRELLQHIQWVIFILTASLAACYLAWLSLAQVNFLYPLWYDLIGIDRTIAVYAPQNRYRQGFEQTTKAERNRLFAAIVDAIHNHGRGLQRLVYRNPRGQSLDRFLRTAEILHLRDVAHLIDTVRPIGLVATIVAGILLFTIRCQRMSIPSFVSLVLGIAIPIGAAVGALLIIGPVEAFYWLHTLIFPPGHDWFFYYQDSLMSTMMKAPDLFGYVAFAWAFLSLALLLAFISATRCTAECR